MDSKNFILAAEKKSLELTVDIQRFEVSVSDNKFFEKLDDLRQKIERHNEAYWEKTNDKNIENNVFLVNKLFRETLTRCVDECRVDNSYFLTKLYISNINLALEEHAKKWLITVSSINNNSGHFLADADGSKLFIKWFDLMMIGLDQQQRDNILIFKKNKGDPKSWLVGSIFSNKNIHKPRKCDNAIQYLVGLYGSVAARHADSNQKAAQHIKYYGDAGVGEFAHALNYTISENHLQEHFLNAFFKELESLRKDKEYNITPKIFISISSLVSFNEWGKGCSGSPLKDTVSWKPDHWMMVLGEYKNDWLINAVGCESLLGFLNTSVFGENGHLKKKESLKIDVEAVMLKKSVFIDAPTAKNTKGVVL